MYNTKKRARLNEDGVWVMPYATPGAIRAPARRTIRSYTPRRGGRSGQQTVSGNLARDNAKKTRVYGVSPQLKKAIKAVLDQESEYKYYRDTQSFQAQGTIAAGDIYDLSPIPAQGTSEGNRVGNEIKVKSFSLDILIAPIASATIMPFVCRILVFRPRSPGGGSGFDLTSLAAAFYDTGTGSAAGDGGWSNQVTVPNFDYIEILYDKVTPVMQWQTAIPTASSAVTNTKIIVNQHRYSIDVPAARGVWKFDDTTGNSTNKAIYVVVQAINITANGTQNAAATDCADVYIASQTQFTDN